MAKRKRNKNVQDHVASMRRTGHREYVEAMASGVRIRPATFGSKKDYKRKTKHRPDWRTA